MRLPGFWQDRITLGTYGPFFRLPLAIPPHAMRSHFHVMGLTGSGKSRFLASLYLQLIDHGLSATLVDPAGDLARLILTHLVASGRYRDPKFFERIIYLDLPLAERRGRFMPFNVLRQRLSPHAVSANVVEAMHRAWPALAEGVAPMFDTLVQNGVKVLLSNFVPLPQLYRFLTDQHFRDVLLANEQDADVVSVFRDWYDKLSPKDQLDMSGSTLRRVNLLTFDPVLKYSLGQSRNVLHFRDILDGNRSVIINLSLGNHDARRLFGSLLTVNAEQGALSRADLPPDQRHGSHHLILDEFSEFSAQSEEALARMLSLTRKYGLFVVMAHQTWSQASERLKGAVQNAGIEVAFGLGRPDAEYSARLVGHVNPDEVKHEVHDEGAMERTHPVFYSLPEQWELWTHTLYNLHPQQAIIVDRPHRRWRRFLHQPVRRVTKIKALPVPDPRVDPHLLTEVEE